MLIKLIVFLIILAVLVLIHELGHFIAAKKNGVYIEEFGFGLPPRLWGKKIGETIYSLNLLPFGGFVKVLGEEAEELTKKKLSPDLQKRTFIAKTPLVKAVIIVAGVVANFLLGWVIISYLFTRGVPVPTERVIVGEVMKNSPADSAGLKKNDVITSIMVKTPKSISYTLKTPEDLITLTKKYAGHAMTLIIVRDKKELRREVVPRTHPPPSEGALGISINPEFVEKKYPWYSAPFFGLVETVRITRFMMGEIVKVLAKLVTFQPVKVDVTGPIGIAQITASAVDVGVNAILQLLGILSLNLAIINILPFPALDGGRLVFIGYEWITKKRVNASVERRVNLIGFALLVFLIILITIKDITRILGK